MMVKIKINKCIFIAAQRFKQSNKQKLSYSIYCNNSSHNVDLFTTRWEWLQKIRRNSITIECKDYRGENWQITKGLSETFVSRLGSQHEWCEMKWEIWPKMIDKEGALLNPKVAGPQCQE
jgi:uncharacterized protein affecting Mg2+/Co2+ transport